MCRYWGRGSLGAVIIGCVVYGLGVRGLWGSVFEVFWVLFRVVVLGGGFWPHVSVVRACVCVRGFAHLVFLQEINNFLTDVKECREVNVGKETN